MNSVRRRTSAIALVVLALMGVVLALSLLLENEGSGGPVGALGEAPSQEESGLIPPEHGTPAGEDGLLRAVVEGQGSGRPAAAPSGGSTLEVSVVREAGCPSSEEPFVRVAAEGAGHTRTTSMGAGTEGVLGDVLSVDTDGVARFLVPDGLSLEVALLDRSAVRRRAVTVTPLVPGELRRIRLTYPCLPDFQFFGRVVSEKGESIQGASVVVLELAEGGSSGGQETGPRERERTMVDSEGYFTLFGRSWARTPVIVRATGRGPVVVRARKGHETPAAAREIVLPLCAEAAVIVHDTRGAPVPGLDLRIGAPLRSLVASDAPGVDDLGWPGSVLWNLTTDAAGIAMAANLAPGVDLDVEAIRERRTIPLGRIPALAAGESTQVSFTLGGTAVIAGRVVDEAGAPVAGVEVWLDSRPTRGHFLQIGPDPTSRARTDSAGRFSFPAVSFGTWYVGPAPRPQEPSSDQVYVVPAVQQVRVGSERVYEIEIRTQRGLDIRGAVLGASGDPFVERAYVEIYGSWQAGGLIASVATKADGTFTVGPLEEGLYILSVRPAGRDAAFEPMVVRAGTSHVELRAVASGVLQGRVLDAETGAGRVASVFLWPVAYAPESGRAEVDLMARFAPFPSRGDGTFESQALPVGEYDILATTRDGRAGWRASVRVGRASEPVELILVPGARVSADFSAFPEPKSVVVSVRSEGIPVGYLTGDSPGASIVVLPGSVRLTVLGHPESTRTLVVAAGETRRVPLSRTP